MTNMNNKTSFADIGKDIGSIIDIAAPIIGLGKHDTEMETGQSDRLAAVGSGYYLTADQSAVSPVSVGIHTDERLRSAVDVPGTKATQGERFFLLETGEWDTTQGQFALLSAMDIMAKLMNPIYSVDGLLQYHKYARFGVEIIVQINSSPFQQGGLIAYMCPGSYAMASSNSAMTLPYGLLNCNTNNVVRLKTPFVYTRGMYDLKDPAYPMMILVLRVWSPLQVGTGTTPAVNYTISGRLVDLELHGILPLGVNDPAKPMQSTQMNVMVLPGQDALNTANSKDTSPTHSLALGNEHFTNDPSAGGSQKITSFRQWLSIPCMFGTFTISTGLATGTMVESWNVSPMQPPMKNPDISVNDQLTNQSYIASQFAYWRGDMVYEMQVFATQYHSCRIMVVYLPGTKPTSTTMTLEGLSMGFTTIYDVVGVQSTMRFRVPYVSDTPYRSTGSSGMDPDASDNIGTVQVYVYNALKCPANVSQEITVNLYHHIENCEFYVPTYGQCAQTGGETTTEVVEDGADGGEKAQGTITGSPIGAIEEPQAARTPAGTFVEVSPGQERHTTDHLDLYTFMGRAHHGKQLYFASNNTVWSVPINLNYSNLGNNSLTGVMQWFFALFQLYRGPVDVQLAFTGNTDVDLMIWFVPNLAVASDGGGEAAPKASLNQRLAAGAIRVNTGRTNALRLRLPWYSFLPAISGHTGAQLADNWYGTLLIQNTSYTAGDEYLYVNVSVVIPKEGECYYMRPAGTMEVFADDSPLTVDFKGSAARHPTKDITEREMQDFHESSVFLKADKVAYPVAFNPDMPVVIFQKLAARVLNMSEDHFWLRCGPKPLVQGATLAECGVRGGSDIDVNLRLRGGSPVPSITQQEYFEMNRMTLPTKKTVKQHTQMLLAKKALDAVGDVKRSIDVNMRGKHGRHHIKVTLLDSTEIRFDYTGLGEYMMLYETVRQASGIDNFKLTNPISRGMYYLTPDSSLYEQHCLEGRVVMQEQTVFQLGDKLKAKASPSLIPHYGLVIPGGILHVEPDEAVWLFSKQAVIKLSHDEHNWELDSHSPHTIDNTEIVRLHRLSLMLGLEVPYDAFHQNCDNWIGGLNHDTWSSTLGSKWLVAITGLGFGIIGGSLKILLSDTDVAPKRTFTQVSVPNTFGPQSHMMQLEAAISSQIGWKNDPESNIMIVWYEPQDQMEAAAFVERASKRGKYVFTVCFDPTDPNALVHIKHAVKCFRVPQTLGVGVTPAKLGPLIEMLKNADNSPKPKGFLRETLDLPRNAAKTMEGVQGEVKEAVGEMREFTTKVTKFMDDTEQSVSKFASSFAISNVAEKVIWLVGYVTKLACAIAIMHKCEWKGEIIALVIGMFAADLAGPIGKLCKTLLEKAKFDDSLSTLLTECFCEVTSYPKEKVQTSQSFMTAVKDVGAVARATKDIGSVLATIMEVIKDLFNRAIGAPKDVDERILEVKTELEIQMTKAEHLLASRTLTHDDWIALDHTWNQLTATRAMVMKGEKASFMAPQISAVINRICSRMTQKPSALATKPRCEPQVLFLYGEPGQGKSLAANAVASRLCKLSGTNFYKDVYTKPPCADFWDGYNNQKVVIVDDLGQATDDKEWTDFCQLVSSCPMRLNMAPVEEKGMFFDSPYIIATSNQIPSKLAPKTVYSATAVRRRLQFNFLVKTLDEFRNEAGFLDPHKAQASGALANLSCLKFVPGFKTETIHGVEPKFSCAKIADMMHGQTHDNQGLIDDIIKAFGGGQNSQMKPGNPFISTKINFYPAICGNTLGKHGPIVTATEDAGFELVYSPNAADFVLAFVPIVSRCGTDIDHAIKTYDLDKYRTLVVFMHHTFDKEYQAPDLRRYMKRGMSCCNVLFHEEMGLLDSVHITDVQRTIYNMHKEVFEAREANPDWNEAPAVVDEPWPATFDTWHSGLPTPPRRGSFSSLPELPPAPSHRKRTYSVDQAIKCECDACMNVPIEVPKETRTMWNKFTAHMEEHWRKYAGVIGGVIGLIVVGTSIWQLVKHVSSETNAAYGGAKSPGIRAVPMRFPNRQKTEGALEISSVVIRNLVRVGMGVNDDTIDFKLNGLCVGEGWVLIPQHFFLGDWSDQYLYVEKNGVVHRAPMDHVDLVHLGGPGYFDVVLVNLPIPASTNIVKHFVTEDQLEQAISTNAMLATMMHGKQQTVMEEKLRIVKTMEYRHTDHSGRVQNIVTGRSIVAKAFTMYGQCGGGLVSSCTKVQTPIMGVHVAGGSGECTAAVITREMLETAMKQSSQMQRMWKTERAERRLPRVRKTTFDKTPFHKEYATRCGRAPAVLSERDKRTENDFVSTMLTKYKKPAVEMAPEGYYETAMELKEELQVCMMSEGAASGPLTMDEAVFGVPGMDPIDLKTSAGIPYIFENITKRDLIRPREKTISGRLRKEVEKLLFDAHHGRASKIIFATFPKDELRAFQKIIDAKTRAIDGSPVHYSVAFRMVFGSAVAFLQSKPGFRTGIGVGVDPDLHWAHWYRDIYSQCDFGLDLDFTAFDGSLQPYMLQAAISILGELAGADTATVTAMMQPLIYSQHQIDDWYYFVRGSLPSGMPATSIVNSLVNLINLRWALRAQDIHPAWLQQMLQMIVYGDDVAIYMKRGHEMKLDIPKLVASLTSLGLEVTDGHKNPIPKLVSVSDVVFLKRNPVLDRDSVIHPAIDPQTIYGLLAWKREAAVLVDNLDTAMWFAYHHGEEIYAVIRNELLENVVKHKIDYVPPTYDALRYRYLQHAFEGRPLTMPTTISEGSVEEMVAEWLSEGPKAKIIGQVQRLMDSNCARVYTENFKLLMHLVNAEEIEKTKRVLRDMEDRTYGTTLSRANQAMAEFARRNMRRARGTISPRDIHTIPELIESTGGGDWSDELTEIVTTLLKPTM